MANVPTTGRHGHLNVPNGSLHLITWVGEERARISVYENICSHSAWNHSDSTIIKILLHGPCPHGLISLSWRI